MAVATGLTSACGPCVEAHTDGRAGPLSMTTNCPGARHIFQTCVIQLCKVHSINFCTCQPGSLGQFLFLLSVILP